MAENIFLRRQLSLYRERDIKPRSTDLATRITMSWLSQQFDWGNALVIIQPRTLIRSHRLGSKMLWGYKCRPGRPAFPVELRQLIREMALKNISWGEERIANELYLKLGIRVSPRTVQKYIPKRTNPGPRDDQRWRTFLTNHAHSILACDFCIVVTATFRILYVLVVVEHRLRRIIHCSVTDHPTADWTRQQFRQTIPCDHSYKYLIHDRDSIISALFDQTIENMGLRVIKTPYRSPKANSICERVIGPIRRECLDYMIPLNQSHLRTVLKSWTVYYNQTRPHMALGPGFPDQKTDDTFFSSTRRHQIADGFCVATKSILGGLHHDYKLVRC